MKKGYLILVLVLLMLPVVNAAYNADNLGKCTVGKEGVKICNVCYDCGEADGICPEDYATGQAVCSTTSDPDCCVVTSIAWQDASGNTISKAGNGESVKLVMTAGAKCAGQAVSFDIWEVELGNDDDYTNDPSPVTVDSTGKATVNWLADGSWNDGWLQGGPEYIFFAKVGSALTYGPSLQLDVAKGPATAQTGGCGDGIIQAGEDPTTCPADAGCDKGEIYCDQDTTPVCKTIGTCEVTPTICSIQAKCLNGLVCDTNDAGCECKADAKDGVFPPQHSVCAYEDPDYDIDGDGIIADNCPLTSNADQYDSDQDGNPSVTGCDYSSAGTGTPDYAIPAGFACGGDACDKDDDNDGVCDKGETSAYCTGSDLCPNTPQDVDLINDLDSDGCSAAQKSCLTQWDCSQTSWSECDESTNTVSRIGACKFSGTDPTSQCKDPAYQPENVKSCTIEAEFPVFSLLNILLTLVLISGFYYTRKI